MLSIEALNLKNSTQNPNIAIFIIHITPVNKVIVDYVSVKTTSSLTETPNSSYRNRRSKDSKKESKNQKRIAEKAVNNYETTDNPIVVTAVKSVGTISTLSVIITQGNDTDVHNLGEYEKENIEESVGEKLTNFT